MTCDYADGSAQKEAYGMGGLVSALLVFLILASFEILVRVLDLLYPQCFLSSIEFFLVNRRRRHGWRIGRILRPSNLSNK